MDISTRALTKVYGSHTVLAGIDLHIPTASQVAFTGPSGVGKTTLLYLLSGIIAPSSGEIYLGSSRLNDYSRRDLQALRRQKFWICFPIRAASRPAERTRKCGFTTAVKTDRARRGYVSYPKRAGKTGFRNHC